MSEKYGFRSAVAGGMVTGLIGGITHIELERTAILAAVGAAVSYLVTLLLKHVIKGRR